MQEQVQPTEPGAAESATPNRLISIIGPELGPLPKVATIVEGAVHRAGHAPWTVAIAAGPEPNPQAVVIAVDPTDVSDGDLQVIQAVRSAVPEVILYAAAQESAAPAKNAVPTAAVWQGLPVAYTPDELAAHIVRITEAAAGGFVQVEAMSVAQQPATTHPPAAAQQRPAAPPPTARPRTPAHDCPPPIIHRDHPGQNILALWAASEEKERRDAHAARSRARRLTMDKAVHEAYRYSTQRWRASNNPRELKEIIDAATSQLDADRYPGLAPIGPINVDVTPPKPRITEHIVVFLVSLSCGVGLMRLGMMPFLSDQLGLNVLVGMTIGFGIALGITWLRHRQWRAGFMRAGGAEILALAREKWVEEIRDILNEADEHDRRILRHGRLRERAIRDLEYRQM